eukprot:scaffold4868_cov148-Skeletonema_dohrnii-CCMP3373.AAC.4
MLRLPQSGYNKIEYTSGGGSSCSCGLNSRCLTLMEKVVGQAQECVAMVFQISLSVYLPLYRAFASEHERIKTYPRIL